MKINYITHNFWIKVWALIFAAGLWFYVAGEESIETRFKVPIKLELAPDMIAAEQKADTLDVYIKGRKEVVAKLENEKLVSKINLISYQEPQTIILSVDRRYLPFGPQIDILYIRPERLEVRIDKLMERVIPVRAVTEGETAPGYSIEGFIIDPIAVKVKGPESYIKELTFIDTETIDVTGRQKSFRKMVPLKAIPMGGEKVPPQFVEVVVKMKEVSKVSTRK